MLLYTLYLSTYLPTYCLGITVEANSKTFISGSVVSSSISPRSDHLQWTLWHIQKFVFPMKSKVKLKPRLTMKKQTKHSFNPSVLSLCYVFLKGVLMYVKYMCSAIHSIAIDDSFRVDSSLLRCFWCTQWPMTMEQYVLSKYLINNWLPLHNYCFMSARQVFDLSGFLDFAEVACDITVLPQRERLSPSILPFPNWDWSETSLQLFFKWNVETYLRFRFVQIF